jgi:hypothetical protein
MFNEPWKPELDDLCEYSHESSCVSTLPLRVHDNIGINFNFASIPLKKIKSTNPIRNLRLIGGPFHGKIVPFDLQRETEYLRSEMIEEDYDNLEIKAYKVLKTHRYCIRKMRKTIDEFLDIIPEKSHESNTTRIRVKRSTIEWYVLLHDSINSYDLFLLFNSNRLYGMNLNENERKKYEEFLNSHSKEIMDLENTNLHECDVESSRIVAYSICE